LRHGRQVSQSVSKQTETGTAHLLHGFVGSGKTTFARRLERTLPAVRFTHDEWVHHLFGAHPPADHFAALYSRIDDLIWRQAVRVLQLGCDVILDHGFWSRESRDRARARVASIGAGAVLYLVACPEAEGERRVSERSRDVPRDSLWIDQAAVELFRKRFEPLEPDEKHVEIDGSGWGDRT
jgi:predicted kinase